MVRLLLEEQTLYQHLVWPVYVALLELPKLDSLSQSYKLDYIRVSSPTEPVAVVIFLNHPRNLY